MKKIKLNDVVVILGVGKHQQVDYSFIRPKYYREFIKNNYQDHIGTLGEVVGTGGIPYHWIRVEDLGLHNMFLHLDTSEIEVVGSVK